MIAEQFGLSWSYIVIGLISYDASLRPGFLALGE